MNHKKFITNLVICLLFLSSPSFAQDYTYPIVDTGQTTCFDNTSPIPCPAPGADFSGQDAQYKGNQPTYRDNGDGTVSDLVTGLMWVKNRGNKVTWDQALSGAESCKVGGYSDWRTPTIKELYSLIDFNGWLFAAPSGKPFINTQYFDFKYGNTQAGERDIDCQDWSATKYTGTTMNGNPTVFGVNFADGRIKGYPIIKHQNNQKNKLYIRYVRGNPEYGKNIFVDNSDKTVTDTATGLIWQKDDSTTKLDWKEALNYCDKLSLAGRSDWRLPNAKELQSIVDYKRSPAATDSAAIDPIFSVTSKESYYWTATTHLNGPRPGNAVYIAFGRAMGYMKRPGSSQGRWMDVHGAGAQRSDPKTGDPQQFPNGHGPQGDDIRINNYVRCVSGGQAIPDNPPPPSPELYSTNGPSNNRMMPPPPPPPRGNNQMQNDMSGMGQYGQMDGNGQGQRRGQGMGYGNGNGMMQGQGQGMRQGPPPQATTACVDMSRGDPCSFQTPRRTITGSCLQMNGMGDQLICVPAEHGRGMGMWE
ncbi:DUF1566 domain-containing protein [Desulfovibrio gilichinskyi]|uniref:Lcl C-terminal domain-containing protein n=1 Tax=Desulfovibrio gilichinskyi TaxID=1519643 RepID=A0A1X7CGZ3_9BACT|nr:DUF1566 domain-containing protein [Desulfovibrio gilichinskyi]SME96119.1 Protein of unknown function [Desulfovibrio gilichinskyi]